MRFRLSSERVDTGQLRDGLKHSGSGGFCAFEGWVRDSNEGREVDGLEYEAYAELAEGRGVSRTRSGPNLSRKPRVAP